MVEKSYYKNNIYYMIIYATINIKTHDFYIGKDKNNNPKYLGSGKILRLAIEKYGKENFHKEIIEFCNSPEHMNEQEKYWIQFYEATKFGYNITTGGEGGDTISNNPNREVIIEKLRYNMLFVDGVCFRRGKKFGPMSEESRKKLSDLFSNGNAPMSGKKHSEETKKIISIKATGRIVSELTRKKLSDLFSNGNAPMSGKKHSEETKKKQSEVKMGDKNGMFGKKLSNEAKKMISDKLTGRVLSQETKDKLRDIANNRDKTKKPKNTRKISIDDVIYNGYNDASKALGVPISTIRNRLKSNNYTTYYYLD